MNKITIAIYLQHYLAPSMTFIYRQLKSAEIKYDPLVLCSDRVENQTKFSFEPFFFKRRNFIHIKKSRYYNKIFGSHSLLSIQPRISSGQSRYFSEILDKHKVKMIHAHFGPSGLEIVNLAKMCRIPLLVTFHGYDASFLLNKKKYIKNLQKLFNYASVISVSNFMKEELIKYGANCENSYVIKCGIPIDFFKFYRRIPVRKKILLKEEVKFLQISSFVEKKGHKYTLLAFQKFIKHYPNAKLILAGDGILRPSMQNLCQKLGLNTHVQFVGLVDEKGVRNLFREADVFLHHSVTSEEGDREGIPTVIMEAMATGLPVISTYHSGIPELITNNINGFLVEERDVESYTSTLLKLKDCPEDIGEKARKKVVEDFNLEIETQKLFNLYNHLIDEKINKT
jgi:colanic acid/amylovoran biosynthesis glycosyltransferase